MPKTRRAGRKNQIRRLYREYKFAPAPKERNSWNTWTGEVGVEYNSSDPPAPTPIPTIEPKIITSDQNLDRESHAVPWRYTLVPATIETPSLPPFDIPENDPRRTRYLQRRAELLHQFYDGPTPQHRGTSESPVIIHWEAPHRKTAGSLTTAYR